MTTKQLAGYPPTYLPGKHVHADTSDLNPGDRGVLRCFKCEAESQFVVGPRGGQHFRPWTKDGKRTPRCPRG